MKTCTTLLKTALLLVAAASIAAGCRPMRTEPAAHGTTGTSEVSYVSINGTTQALYIPAARPGAPVLLWLNGSPGSSEIVLVRRQLQPLHQYFNVVGWDQRGTGQSAHSVSDPSLVKVDQYVKDLIAVAEHLRKRYSQEKIYLAGLDWGGVIGTKAVQQRPDLFAALVNVSPRVNTRETDRRLYEAVRENVMRSGDQSLAKQLDRNGPPPYTARDLGKYTLLFSAANEYLPRTGESQFQALDPRNHFSAFDRKLDRVGSTRGAGMNYVYPQLADLDLETQAAELEVPVFFVIGRWDFITPKDISQRYYDKLRAPVKDVAVFKGSGHYACYEQPEEFTAFMVDTVLSKTQASAKK